MRWILVAMLFAGCVPDVRLHLADAVVDAPADMAAEASLDAQDGAPLDAVDAAQDAFTIDLPPGPTVACMGAEEGLRRECGWSYGGTFSCTPGTMVTLGCDPYCEPALGSCDGDTVLRVCDGVAFCANSESIATGDDSCMVGASRSFCARTTLACPTSGRFTALVGSYRIAENRRCVLGALNAMQLR